MCGKSGGGKGSGSRGSMTSWSTNAGHPAGMWPPFGSRGGGKVTGKFAALTHWVTWPFRLDAHQPTCRWRRFVRLVTFGATP